MGIIFPAFNEPFPQRKVEVRIPDENEERGYATLLVVQISKNIAASIHNGALELLQIEETELEECSNPNFLLRAVSVWNPRRTLLGKFAKRR